MSSGNNGTTKLALSGRANLVANLGGPAHRFSAVTEERRRWAQINRYAPLRGLTPDLLTSYLDNWALGYLRQCALAWDAIASRDYILRTVIPKRLAAGARHDWQIAIPERYAKDPQAQEHKEVLTKFYQNLRVTDALKPDMIGGVRLLAQQMLWAHGMGYAVHEILWRQDWSGMSATLVHVPTWFFERRTGKLRFLLRDFDIDGQPLEDGAWMVTCGDTLMEASSVCWMYKNLSMKDWLTYSEKQSMPAIFGKTVASPDSAQWKALEEAVTQVLSGAAGVINNEDEIEKISFAAEGQLPQPQLVDLMDRALSSLWRGADLSTISAGQGTGQGASLQSEESGFLESNDTAMVSETCQLTLDRLVIRNAFGPGVEPKAYFSLGGAKRVDVNAEIAVDKFLLESGAPMGIDDTLERYNRARPDPEEELLSKPAPPNPFGGPPGASGGPPGAPEGEDEGISGDGLKPSPGSNQEEEEDETPTFAADEKPSRASVRKPSPGLVELMRARAEDLRPVAMRVHALVNEADDDAFAAKLSALRGDLPKLLPKTPGLAAVLERRLAAAFKSGWEARSGVVANEDDAANAFVGHAGRPGEVGGSLPADAGAGGVSDREIRSQRSKAGFKPATREKQQIADAKAGEVANAIGGQTTGDNDPFDAISGRYAVEVKTLVDAKHDQITMHPESLKRKERFARRNKVEAWTVAIDTREGRNDLYVKRGVGNFKLSSMTKLEKPDDLAGHIAAKSKLRKKEVAQ